MVEVMTGTFCPGFIEEAQDSVELFPRSLFRDAIMEIANSGSCFNLEAADCSGFILDWAAML